jgi:hypothetical protein
MIFQDVTVTDAGGRGATIQDRWLVDEVLNRTAHCVVRTAISVSSRAEWSSPKLRVRLNQAGRNRMPS